MGIIEELYKSEMSEEKNHPTCLQILFHLFRKHSAELFQDSQNLQGLAGHRVGTNIEKQVSTKVKCESKRRLGLLVGRRRRGGNNSKP